MAKFNPALLVPAQQAPEFSKGSAARTVHQVALDNIAKMKEQFQAGDAAEGKLNFKVAGASTSFTIRVNNSALVLGQYEQDGVTADVKEMAVPTANFVDALGYFADKIKAGEFDTQLAALSEKREARTAKMRATRASKKADKPA
jgi:hypothetical protein